MTARLHVATAPEPPSAAEPVARLRDARERILAEIAWGRAHGATQIHFVEANLNLVPVFWPF